MNITLVNSFVIPADYTWNLGEKLTFHYTWTSHWAHLYACVSVTTEQPSGEYDGSTPWPPVSETTSKGPENLMNLTTLCDTFYLCVGNDSALQCSSICNCTHCVCVCVWALVHDVCLCLNDDAFTSCYTLSELGHNTGLQLCLWDKHLLSSFIL